MGGGCLCLDFVKRVRGTIFVPVSHLEQRAEPKVRRETLVGGLSCVLTRSCFEPLLRPLIFYDGADALAVLSRHHRTGPPAPDVPHL